MTELAKTFDPAAIESRWYAHWEGQGLFRPDRPDATPFTIVMPPPNVTGSLHIGHALDITLQDILVRIARMQGKDSLWVVGTDHAGIATQMVVERQLDAAGRKRTDFTRDEFVAKVKEWKEESGGQITQQLRRLGASCDWANERFTMDEGFSKAVTHVFVELHKRGLLYRDKRLVNWDPKFQSAISDLEVETREVQGKFWTLRYPLADGSGYVEVATTRPETMLADMAVAVHPTDERYTALVGKMVKLPITGRLIPIITDEHADPELGSGAVKITPGHDFNDFEVGKRAGFKPGDMLNMLDASAKVVQCGGIPDELIGLDRFDARKAVVDALGEALVKVEDRTIATPFGDRSGVVIEPWLTDQWYVDAATLAKPAIEAVKSGAVKVVPESWVKTWFNWLENIQPWCVSRQLWWGHQIPAYFGPNPEHFGKRLSDMPDGQMLPDLKFVGQDHASVRLQAFAQYEAYGIAIDDIVIHDDVDAWARAVGEPSKVNILRDQDVLDTWFSSALWPFATLGWPEQTSDLARHYPNDVLISGFDILFFWDARMAMQGIEFMGAPPWKTLYLHGLVRDAHGAKMSKSKGNTVDPLGLIDRYGADALRFTMAAMESQGRDIKLDEKRVEGYRNFATKLWNAARFLQGNGVGASTSIAAPPAALPVNRWIIGEVVETLAKMDQALADLRFDETANAIYQFTWATFCDWYVELVKGGFDDETRAVAAWAFDQILVMLHPLMPFITEELWHAMGVRDYDLIVAQWPAPDASENPIIGFIDGQAVDAKAEISWIIETIVAVRGARNDVGIPAGQQLNAFLEDVTSNQWQRLPQAAAVFKRLGRIAVCSTDKPPVGSALRIAIPGATLVVPLEGVIDLDAERARLEKAIAVAAKDRDGLASRLANPAFAERAKPEAVDKARADHDARAAEVERLSAALARLG
ncbi:valine--tRNA ligase [Sphingomonas sp.]|uniref:valine--tRNA ligase n=1 Tax=Sphingomonas sp. TaxID=28214 RepID=UPI00375143AB